MANLRLIQNVGIIRVGSETVREILYKGEDSQKTPFLFYTYFENDRIQFRYLNTQLLKNVTAEIDPTTKVTTLKNVVIMQQGGLQGEIVLFSVKEGDVIKAYDFANHSDFPSGTQLNWAAGVMGEHFVNVPDNLIVGATEKLTSDVTIKGNATDVNSSTLAGLKTPTKIPAGGVVLTPEQIEKMKIDLEAEANRRAQALISATNNKVDGTKKEETIKEDVSFFDAPGDWIKENPLLAGVIGVVILIVILFIIVPLMKGESVFGGAFDGASTKSKNFRRMRR